MSDPFDFTHQTAIVTGAARGIGRAIGEALSLRGADVQGFDWDPGKASELAFPVHKVDISDATAVAELVGSLSTPPSLLVNNAGITRDRSIAKMSDQEWAEVISVNLTGAFNVLRAVAPAMTQAGYGRIVNITSINGMRGKFGQANYAAAKAGLIGLTKTAAREWGRKGVTVNALAPGMVMTNMAKQLPQQILDTALGEAMTERLASPEDIAYATMFLLSKGAAMITGEVLRVDGGQYI
ncbi:MAG: SDR family oxidoreductase [Rhodospirillales bacterium]|nr:SDR family oxidoreductase [Rhodospirillales bacterium]